MSGEKYEPELSYGSGGRGWLGQQFAYTIGELCAFRHPVINPLALQFHASWVGAGIVSTHHFDRTPIASAILFDDNDTVIRLLGGANARQTNHDHGDTFPFNSSESDESICLNEYASVTQGRLEIQPAPDTTSKYR